MAVKEFWQVDAFARERYKGNPCAVVFEADDIPTEAMQRIAAEMNLSETVFILRPSEAGADYHARIFTPRSELPFAGHPTVAAAFAVLGRGIAAPSGAPPILRQQCGIGIVPVEVAGEGEARELIMTQGAPEYRGTDLDAAAVARMLGCGAADILDHPFEVVSTGVPWLMAVLRDREVLAALEPDLGSIEMVCRGLDAIGISPISLDAFADGCSVKVRAFAPGQGVPEDPVTGSANGCIGAYISRHGLLGGPHPAYRAEQGTEMGRDGEVFVECLAGEDGGLAVRVGGAAVQVMEGRLTL